MSETTAFKAGDEVSRAFLPSTVPYTNLQTLSAYADNFDLSLLPQDCDASTLNIPTTVYQYINDTPINNASTAAATTPEIKTEQIWQQVDQIKLELYLDAPVAYGDNLQRNYQQYAQQQAKSANQLIPPPAYPHVYPSPQSSPAQSEYGFPQAQFAGCYDSLSSSRTSLYASSPCPSIDASSIKQELHILPPSPPESSCEVPSPGTEYKTEPCDTDVETLVSDLNSLIRQQEKQQNDNQLLREYLQDTTFQKQHNLKPLALESFIGGLEAVRGDIEPVISLALQHAKREADETCRQLQISHDPKLWTPAQVHAWLRSTINQFQLPEIENLQQKFQEDGAALVALSEEEFARRVPEVSKRTT